MKAANAFQQWLMQTEVRLEKQLDGRKATEQVMPFWARVLADGDASVLFQAQTNLRFGSVILRHYLNVEHGDLWLALGRYNGSRAQAPYPHAVLAAQKGWQ
jgi:soluble lytic murein transglycosylase-like protein